jgi:hypothetical protein
MYNDSALYVAPPPPIEDFVSSTGYRLSAADAAAQLGDDTAEAPAPPPPAVAPRCTANSPNCTCSNARFTARKAAPCMPRIRGRMRTGLQCVKSAGTGATDVAVSTAFRETKGSWLKLLLGGGSGSSSGSRKQQAVDVKAQRQVQHYSATANDREEAHERICYQLSWQTARGVARTHCQDAAHLTSVDNRISSPLLLTPQALQEAREKIGLRREWAALQRNAEKARQAWERNQVCARSTR